MGGEKLKSLQTRWGLLFAAVLLVAGFFNSTVPLMAQTGGAQGTSAQPAVSSESASPAVPAPAAPVTADPASDESSIIIGETPAVPAPTGTSSIAVVLRMVLVLALAALAIYGVVFFIKRLARPQEARDPHLKVLARVPLGNDTFAAVVSVGSKAWLVGGGSGAVNLISEIDETEPLETMLLDDANKSAEAGMRGFVDFRSLIKRLGGASQAGRGGRDSERSHTEKGSLSESGSLSENLRKQRERLKGL